MRAAIGVAKYKTADTTIDSGGVGTTFTDDPHLAGWDMSTPGFYMVDGYLEASAISTTPDMKFLMQFTAGTGHHYSGWTYLGALTTTALLVGQKTALETTNVIQLSSAARSGVILRGYVEVDEDCTMDFQWAQNTSSVDDVVLHEGSWINVRHIGP